jgi:hypothetical protein
VCPRLSRRSPLPPNHIAVRSCAWARSKRRCWKEAQSDLCHLNNAQNIGN